MKKTLLNLVLASVLVGTIVPMAALAQEGPATGCTITHDVGIEGCPDNWADDGNCPFDSKDKPCGICCLMNAVYTVTDWMFFVLIAVTGFLVIWGGFNITTAGGSEEKLKQGKDFILFAMIGLAIALFAKAIPALVRTVLGV
ncbi:MAG: hypothetical protein IB617_00495 [Candidatus Nealsonbacteria bacterium]|nr:MAG: hypothetical protein IB617_00495 [Candidatus Nealsonbacteria bacterium]